MCTKLLNLFRNVQISHEKKLIYLIFSLKMLMYNKNATVCSDSVSLCEFTELCPIMAAVNYHQSESQSDTFIFISDFSQTQQFNATLFTVRG